MSCSPFRDALQVPDASTPQLQRLVATGDYSGDSLGPISEDFLHAFCDSKLSYTRRRWIGIALAKMLDGSPKVVQHLDAVEQQLQGLGDVILSPTEREETKIVAGIVVRQALEQHIEFAKFWASDKIRNSAPRFPVTSTATWLQDFQSFLDTLGDLALANPLTDPVIIYAVSVFASDSFQWASSKDRVLTAIMQHDRLTLILPDTVLQDIQFLDIPASHIGSVNARPSGPLPDSQSRSTTHEPWDLILKFKDESLAYLLNTSKRKAKELTILFERKDDAVECEIALRELKEMREQGNKDRQIRAMASSISLTRSGSQLGKAVPGGREARRRNEQPRSGSSQQNTRIQKRSTKSNHAMQHRPSSPTARAAQSSSDELGNTPVTRASSSHRLPQQPDAGSHSKRGDRMESTMKDHYTPLAPTQRNGSATQRAIADIELAPKHGGIHDPTKQDGNLITKQSSQARAGSNDTSAVPAQDRMGKPVDQTDGSDHTSPVPKSTHSASVKFQQSHTSGKLPKVAPARKRRSSQQVGENLDVFAIPSDDNRKTATRKQDAAQKISSPAPGARADTQKGNGPSKAREERTLRLKSRTKRRAEEEGDDDFAPTAKPTKKTANKRKAVAEAMLADEKPKKKAKAEHKASARSRSSRSKADLTSEQGSDAPVRGMDSRRTELRGQQNSLLPIVASRAPLIGGLLSSQHPIDGDKTAFKKPALPSRATQPPSTPTQRPTQPRKAAICPHTGGSHSTPSAALMSSPPANGFGFGDDDDPQDDAREAEILSSNSKPLPASPHADSTAITGHADRFDVDLEKKRSEVQTAKSDPFRHQRDSPRTTPFVRRLTGDKPIPFKPGLSKSMSSPSLFQARNIHVAVKTTSQPLPQAPSFHEQDSLPAAKPTITSQRDHLKGRPADEFEIFLEDQAKKTGPTSTPQALPTTTSARSRVAKHEGSRQKKRKSATGKENMAFFASQPTEHETGDTHEPTGATHGHEGLGADGDTTLVNDESEEPLPLCGGTPPFRSSLPGTPSDHSSTSAESESSPPRSPPTSEVEEMEWEATLQPHQRALHDQLMRVSKRVLRHVVDNETAVTDIADVYASDGEHLVKTILERQDGEYKELWDDLDAKKVALKKELERSARGLAKERQRVTTLS